MSLARIAPGRGKPAAYRRAVAGEVHRALVEVANVPSEDPFQILTEHAPDDLIEDAGYPDSERTDDIVVVQITLNQRP